MSESLERARLVLRRAEQRAPSFGAEGRARARLRESLGRRWYEPTWRQVAPALVAMAAGWVVVVVTAGRGPQVEVPAAEVAAAEVAAAPAASAAPWVAPEVVWPGLRFGQTARYVLPELGAPRPVLLLHLGIVEAALEPGQTLRVDTAQASISALAARFQVEALLEETRIGVSEGTVRVQASEAPDQTLRAGQRLSVPARRVAGAPELTPPSPSAEGEQRSTLAAAQQALANDAPRAAALAEEVLGQGPSSEIEVQALALLADAERRRGAHRRAYQVYGRVAGHPGGRGYAEEALYRQAALAMELGQVEEALGPLREAEKLFSNGPLAPERVVLMAHLELKRGHPDRAAAALLRVPVEGRPSLLAEARLEVAAALARRSPALARSLLTPILSHNGVPDELLRRAQQQLEDDEPGAPAQLR